MVIQRILRAAKEHLNVMRERRNPDWHMRHSVLLLRCVEPLNLQRVNTIYLLIVLRESFRDLRVTSMYTLVNQFRCTYELF